MLLERLTQPMVLTCRATFARQAVGQKASRALRRFQTGFPFSREGRRLAGFRDSFAVAVANCDRLGTH